MIYYEADFIPVGDGEKGGDAAAIRVWDDTGTQMVFVVDGGTTASGEALVAHIREHYGTTTVDAAICTHPDADHASGLAIVLEELTVRTLFMHEPWSHADDICRLFANTALNPLGLQRSIRKGLKFAHDLKKIADRKNIPIIEPFAGDAYFNGLLRFLGPSLEHYQAMLLHFRKTPDPAQPPAPLGPLGLILSQAGNAASAAVEWIDETLDIETLTDEGGHFSAENSSSAITLFTFGTDKLLFTGDADIDALNQSVDHAGSIGIPLTDLRLLDVPHHGSKRNIGPTILNSILARVAHISAPADSPKHPSKRVVNALIRRGMPVHSTQGQVVCYHGDQTPVRAGWSAATPLSFFDRVEA